MSDVLVVGGGLVGVGIAWRAAVLGCRVTCVDDAPGDGASRAAAGMLAPASELAYAEEALLPLGQESLRRYPDFLAALEESTGLAVTHRDSGTLLVGLDADDVAEVERQRRFQVEQGAGATALTARQCRALEPALSPRVRAGAQVPGDGSVSARELHAALLRAGELAGVRMVRQRAAEVTCEAGRVTGVRLDDGTTLAAPQVVLAAGAWSAGLAGVPAGEVPVRPVKGQVLRLHGQQALLEGTVRAVVRGRRVYLVPSGGGGLVVGATVEEQGFDATVRAGAVLDLLRDAVDVVPDVAELELVEALARWRPATPDNLPVIGFSAVPGLLIATGHYRNGVLLTPVTAHLVVEALVSGATPGLLEPFSPRRFQEPDRGIT